MSDISSLGAVKAHVLIVDDRPDDLRLLVENLRSNELHVSIALDGVQGYDRALALTPDLILMETSLPRMDGLALTRRLKSNPATKDTPILFLSANSGLNERLASLREGAVDYIVKPFSPEEVLERVRIHLRLARADYEQCDRSVAKKDLSVGASESQVLVRAAQNYLIDKLSAPPTLAELASALGAGNRQLSTAFQDCLGITLFEFIRRQRMHKAQRLLRQTQLSITVISEEVGFSSAANFSTAFREYSGASPSAYRKSIIGS